MELTARTLDAGRVRLEPFEERHREGLAALATAEPDLFRHMPFAVARDGYSAWFDMLRADQDAGRSIPHAIFADDKLAGQSCYLNIRRRDAGVEIGSTWYLRDAHGTFLNPACKLALIANAFESGAERVELKTDALNAQSRAALLKLGATFEGIHRRHMRRADGTLRDTAWYAIIAEDWPGVRAQLETRLAEFSTQ